MSSPNIVSIPEVFEGSLSQSGTPDDGRWYAGAATKASFDMGIRQGQNGSVRCERLYGNADQGAFTSQVAIKRSGDAAPVGFNLTPSDRQFLWSPAGFQCNSERSDSAGSVLWSEPGDYEVQFQTYAYVYSTGRNEYDKSNIVKLRLHDQRLPGAEADANAAKAKFDAAASSTSLDDARALISEGETKLSSAIATRDAITFQGSKDLANVAIDSAKQQLTAAQNNIRALTDVSELTDLGKLATLQAAVAAEAAKAGGASSVAVAKSAVDAIASLLAATRPDPATFTITAKKDAGIEYVRLALEDQKKAIARLETLVSDASYDAIAAAKERIAESLKDLQASGSLATARVSFDAIVADVNNIDDLLPKVSKTMQSAALALAADARTQLQSAEFTYGLFDPTTARVERLAPPQLSSGKLVSAYYTNWSGYDRKFQVADIAKLGDLDVLNYAFLKIEGGTCKLYDPQADIGSATDTGSGQVGGHIAALQAAKKAHPGLSVLASVGGWTLSKPFFEIAKSDTARTKLARSCVALMHDFGFDGLDIDWEYPVTGGETPELASTDDKANFTLLMQDFDKALAEADRVDNATATGGASTRHYLLTAAMSGSASGIVQSYDLPSVGAVLDLANVMAYDYSVAQAGGGQVGHNAGTWQGALSQANVSGALSAYRAGGFPMSKVLLGVPAYGRSYAGVVADTASIMNGVDAAPQTYTGVGPGTWEAGSLDYDDIVTNYLGKAGVIAAWDEAAGVPFLYDTQAQVWVSYDDERSTEIKGGLVADQGLRGAMFWELSADRQGALRSAVRRGFASVTNGALANQLTGYQTDLASALAAAQAASMPAGVQAAMVSFDDALGKLRSTLALVSDPDLKSRWQEAIAQAEGDRQAIIAFHAAAEADVIASSIAGSTSASAISKAVLDLAALILAAETARGELPQSSPLAVPVDQRIARMFDVLQSARDQYKKLAEAVTGGTTGGGTAGGGTGSGSGSGGSSPNGALQAITAVRPARGPVAGGNTVAIVGFGFTGATKVLIGGNSASFTVVNDAHVEAVIPPGRAGSADVSVVLTPSRGRAFAPGGYVYEVVSTAVSTATGGASGAAPASSAPSSSAPAPASDKPTILTLSPSTSPGASVSKAGAFLRSQVGRSASVQVQPSARWTASTQLAFIKRVRAEALRLGYRDVATLRPASRALVSLAPSAGAALAGPVSDSTLMWTSHLGAYSKFALADALDFIRSGSLAGKTLAFAPSRSWTGQERAAFAKAVASLARNSGAAKVSLRSPAASAWMVLS